ncbi:MAG TPA: hypothetical protein PK006_01795 [Saprospiraceae bacterium]|nr:hypothetical protein [Saprospiraceae bacterium]
MIPFSIAFICCKSKSTELISNNNPIDSTAKDTNGIVVNNVSAIIGGTYGFGDTPENGPTGRLLVYPTGTEEALIFLEVINGPPNHNSGEIIGKIKIIEELPTYVELDTELGVDCKFYFDFVSDQVSLNYAEDHYKCGLGNAVSIEESYPLLSFDIPEYFVDMEGDTTYFKDLAKTLK